MAQDSQKKVLELFAHANSSIGASTASITLKVIGCIFAVAVHTWQSSPSPFKIFHTWRPKHGQGVMEFSLTEPSWCSSLAQGRKHYCIWLRLSLSFGHNQFIMNSSPRALSPFVKAFPSPQWLPQKQYDVVNSLLWQTNNFPHASIWYGWTLLSEIE